MTWIKGLGGHWTFHGREPVKISRDTSPLLSGGGHVAAVVTVAAVVSRPGRKDKPGSETQWSETSQHPRGQTGPRDLQTRPPSPYGAAPVPGMALGAAGEDLPGAGQLRAQPRAGRRVGHHVRRRPPGPGGSLEPDACCFAFVSESRGNLPSAGP